MRIIQSLTVNLFLPVTIACGAWCYCTGRVGGWTLFILFLSTCKVTWVYRFKG